MAELIKGSGSGVGEEGVGSAGAVMVEALGPEIQDIGEDHIGYLFQQIEEAVTETLFEYYLLVLDFRGQVPDDVQQLDYFLDRILQPLGQMLYQLPATLLQLVRVEYYVAHAQAEGLADVVWFFLHRERFYYEQEVSPHLKYLLLALFGVGGAGLARLLVPDRYEVDFEFVF